MHNQGRAESPGVPVCETEPAGIRIVCVNLMKEQKKVHLARLRELLERSRELRNAQITPEGLSPSQQLLAEWQADRLARTYADLQREPRYQPAIEFFLTDLYGPRDFSQRDHDVERVYPLMARVLSEHAIHSIALAMELHALSQDFDARMARILTEELGVTDQLDPDTYAEAFRRCNDFPLRRRQIELVGNVGRVLEEVVRKPVIYAAVRVAHRPAHAMGFGELQDFVERGFRAFRHMDGATYFVNTVLERETRLLEQIVAGEPAEVWYAQG